MCNLATGATLSAVGGALVVLTCSISFTLVPNVIESIIKSEVWLKNGTEQWERFEKVPFGLTFNVRLFNITNPVDVLNGSVPEVREVGPYVYKSLQYRVVEELAGDKVVYHRKDLLKFDVNASLPHSEDDMVTVVNVAYHGVLQMAENLFPNLMGALSLAMSSIFGIHNHPIMTVRVRDLLFDGIPICQNPGFVGMIACAQIRNLGANLRNMELQADGTLEFSALKFKNNTLSELYVAHRGVEDVSRLGIIVTYNGTSHVTQWRNDQVAPGKHSRCNMVNGTDSGIFPPFVDRENSVYAFNTDICRSVELRYQFDTMHEGIPAARFSANEWLLDNNEGCFCLNVTTGITRPDGCMLDGAMELFTCMGAYMVMSYPHFLYADFRYRNAVIGMHPDEEKHRIFVDLEPHTGTVIRGMKRAQFNIFMRPVTSIPATSRLRTTLVPFLWIEEGMELPYDYVNLLKTRLLQNLRLVDILIPVIIALSCLVLVLGVVILVRVRTMNKA